MATLNLDDGYRTKVWRVLKEAIEGDAKYDQAGVRLSFFDGDPEVLSDPDGFQSADLQFFPACGDMSWFDESNASGALVVAVEARLPRPDVEDIFNLQEQLERTLNSLGDLAFQRKLTAAGAATGLILFRQPLRPAAGKPGADNVFRLTGQFVIEVLRPLNP